MMVKLPVPISFEWDQHNQYKNWHKHGIDYRECEEIFFNTPLKIFQDIKHSQTEPRFFALGQTNHNRFLFVAFTIRNQHLRVISARDQSQKERRLYVQN